MTADNCFFVVFLALFACLALPVTKKWVKEMNVDVKTTLMELLPWRIFLYLHHSLILSAFSGKSLYYFGLNEDKVHTILAVACVCGSLHWL